MSDTKLRELERRWKETGAVEDEAAYLLERVRVGDLTQERLELAAYCGHEGARRAMQQDALPLPSDVPERVTGLIEVAGLPVLALAIVAGVRSLLPLWRADAPVGDARRVLDLVEAWAVTPDADHMRAVEAFTGPNFLHYARRFSDDESASVIARAVNAAHSVVLEARAPEFFVRSLPKAAVSRVVRVLGAQAAWDQIAKRVVAFALGAHCARE